MAQVKTYQTNNTRIAKNTLFLYVRMIFILLVTLYTSRVILNVLGIEDYGIYSIVGGVVTMFGFLSSAMSSTTQRYISFALGKKDPELPSIFSHTVFIHLIIAVVVLMLIETIGLWLLYYKLIIPSKRFTAAFWVFQLSTLTALVSIVSVPYNATIIAHEKMSAFAYISIIEVLLKLCLALALSYATYDKLIIYSLLLFCIQLVIRIMYQRYCLRNFSECKFKLHYRPSLLKEMFCFAGWNLWGNLSSVLFTQGINVLLNIFFGPLVNAARGIATQVNSAVMQFSLNFQMALTPQITKSYAAGDIKSMHNLIYRSAKFSYLLLLVICTPIMLETGFILKVWLIVVPEWSVSFIRIILCITMIDAMANPLMNAAASTGNIKLYQAIIGGTLLLIVPIAYLVLELGGNPLSAFIVHLVICCIAFTIRLFFLKHLIALSLRTFLTAVIWKCFLSTIIAVGLPFLCYYYFSSYNIHISIIILSFLTAAFSSYFLGLTSNEKIFIHKKIRAIRQKLFS